MRLLLFVLTLLLLPGLLPSHAQTLSLEKPVSRVAFGSCANQNEPQPIWDAIARLRPDVFLFLGDCIYADANDTRAVQVAYQRLAARVGFRDLRKVCPFLATWDDGEYGINNAGAENPRKQTMQQMFLDFWGEPANSPRRVQDGVYDSRIIGPEGKRLQIILLDTRYNRSPLKHQGPDPVNNPYPYAPDEDPSKTMLGAAQWKWLEEQLRKPAELRLIVSSIQVVAEDYPFEKWANLPRERQRLFDLIGNTNADGVIFLSGDRHLAELSVQTENVPYPLYDLTSSALNQSSRAFRPYEANRRRVATLNTGDNFGMVDIDWSKKRVNLLICDAAGEVAIQQKLAFSVLRPEPPKNEEEDAPPPSQIPAQVVYRPDLDVPDELFARQTNGVLTVRITIEADGKHTPEIVKGSGDAALDKALLAWLRQWEWKPARKNGKAIRTIKTQKITF